MGRTANSIRLKRSRILHTAIGMDAQPVVLQPNLKTLIQQVNVMVAELPNAEMKIQDNQLKVFILEYKEI